MLVLTRRIDESIMLYLGELEIEVKLMSNRGNQASIGIQAPPEVAIVRKELVKEDASCDRDDCNWVDARNEVIQSGEVCTTCRRMRAGNHAS